MKKLNRDGVFRLLRLLPLAVIVICAAFFWRELASVTPQEIAARIGGDPAAAIVFVLLGYTLECLSVVFPVVVMQLAVSLIFPVWAALLLNLVGLALAANLGYFIGKFTGEEPARRFARKYGREDMLSDIEPARAFHYAFLLRVISVLPMDAVSMVLGSVGTPYLPYLLGTLAGTIPSMAAVTVAGASATDPGSPAFIVSVSVTVLLSAVSIVCGRLRRRRAKKEAEAAPSSGRGSAAL